jgi:hypothetical protein
MVFHGMAAGIGYDSDSANLGALPKVAPLPFGSSPSLPPSARTCPECWASGHGPRFY